MIKKIIPEDYVPVHAVQYAHKTRILDVNGVFYETPPIMTLNLDASNSKNS